MCARCTGRDRRVVGAAQAVTHGDEPRGDVGDEHGNEERADPLRSALEHDACLLLERADPADPAPDDHADPVAVQAIELVGEPGILDRLLGDGNGELREAVGAAYLLAVEVLLRLEVLHLAREADVEPLRRVELRDRRCPAPALEQRGPGTRYVVAHGCDQPDAGHDDTSSRSVACLHAPPPRPVSKPAPLASSPTRPRPCAPGGSEWRPPRSGAARPPRPGS